MECLSSSSFSPCKQRQRRNSGQSCYFVLCSLRKPWINLNLWPHLGWWSWHLFSLSYKLGEESEICPKFPSLSQGTGNPLGWKFNMTVRDTCTTWERQFVGQPPWPPSIHWRVAGAKIKVTAGAFDIDSGIDHYIWATKMKTHLEYRAHVLGILLYECLSCPQWVMTDQVFLSLLLCVSFLTSSHIKEDTVEWITAGFISSPTDSWSALSGHTVTLPDILYSKKSRSTRKNFENEGRKRWLGDWGWIREARLRSYPQTKPSCNSLKQNESGRRPFFCRDRIRSDNSDTCSPKTWDR